MINQCTCTKDKEITCIVHPTERAMKERIAELEVENAKLRVTLLKEAAKAVVDSKYYLGGPEIEALAALLEQEENDE